VRPGVRADLVFGKEVARVNLDLVYSFPGLTSASSRTHLVSVGQPALRLERPVQHIRADVCFGALARRSSVFSSSWAGGGGGTDKRAWLSG
jgi:hypothetical protein